jgi:ADP-ribosyl-[dinitrogen reductase] hydrolase
MDSSNQRVSEDSVVGCLVGTAVGDALGLPVEGLTKRRQQQLFGEIGGHRFFLHRGMVSDDTDHTSMVAQALTASSEDVDLFTKELAIRLRRWFLSLPAGIGMATLKACVRLCLGVSPQRSGVFSAGNGPAMRSAIIGVCFGYDPTLLRSAVRASTHLTHTDPKAEWGALAVALAASLWSQGAEIANLTTFMEKLQGFLEDEPAQEFRTLLEAMAASVNQHQSTEDFANGLGLVNGVSGYVYHTVPVALHAAFSFPTDYRSAVLSVLRCGGDTDTAGAIVGGIVGAGVGRHGIPDEWVNDIWEWPKSISWIESLGHQLTDTINNHSKQPPISAAFYAQLLRNVLFLFIILMHGFRRVFPPY